MDHTSEPWECIVVGAGPAGLSAALYLARFRRRVLVLHDGMSRAMRIPLTRNAPGFPEGIAGPDLVGRMLEHCERYGAQVREAEVVEARRHEGTFGLRTADGVVHHGRALVLATGLHMGQIPLPHEEHEAAIAAGVLRYCPICDGIEHADTRIAVLGSDRHGAAEALFLRQFSEQVALLPCQYAGLDADAHAQLTAAGIRVLAAPVVRYAPQADRFDLYLEGRDEPHTFDVVYPALGSQHRNELAQMLGIAIDAHGCTNVASPLGTEVPGAFCAGDIVDGLDQISVAMGHGAVAATRAHNWLRAEDGHVLPPGENRQASASRG